MTTDTMRNDAAPAKQRLYCLDAIRAFAIFCIVFHHYPFNLPGKESLLGMRPGYLGVSLFVILSGAALYHRYRDSFSAGEFFRNRVMGILPTYYVAYLFCLFSFIIITGRLPYLRPPEIWTFGMTLTGMDGFLNFKFQNFYLIGEWFIGFVICLYLLFPILRFVYLKNRYLLLTIAAGVSLFFIYRHSAVLGVNFVRFPLTRVFEFCVGFMLVELIVKRDYRVFLAGAGLTVCSYLVFAKLGLAYLGAFYAPFLFLSLALGYTLLPKHACFDRIVLFLSKYSYAAFLVHHVFYRVSTYLISGKVYNKEAYFIASYFFIYLVGYYVHRLTASMIGLVRGK